MIKINPASSKPLSEQIIDSIKSDYVKGFLKSGDEVPSVRKLAIQLSVTPNAVAKAYQELERDGIIVTIRGKGTYISSEQGIRIDNRRLEELRKELSTKIVELTCMGCSKEEIVSIVEKICDEVKEG